MSKRILFQIFGLILISLGITLIIKSKLGAFPMDTLSVYVNKISGSRIKIGYASIFLSIIIFFINYYLRRKIIYIIGVFFVVINGLLINLWLDLLIFDLNNIIIRLLISFLGILLISIGVNFNVLTKLPAMPIDQLLIILSEKNNKVAVNKIFIEGTVLLFVILTAFFVKKPFEELNFFTLVCILIIGPLIELTSKVTKSIYEKGDNYKK